MTIKEYATYKNISVQSVHKRLKNIKNYPEIRSVKRISNYLFVLKINTGNDLAK
jgi:ribosomal protein L15E